eukprot:6179975-Pleurochrysis_carterae.AAC.2
MLARRRRTCAASVCAESFICIPSWASALGFILSLDESQLQQQPGKRTQILRRRVLRHGKMTDDRRVKMDVDGEQLTEEG